MKLSAADRREKPAAAVVETCRLGHDLYTVSHHLFSSMVMGCPHFQILDDNGNAVCLAVGKPVIETLNKIFTE